ncbi:helix-turn-helix domain-containing protein [Paenibacillus macerans]|uniref:Helix-turn-helix domain-containing protein n=1 Tax=Paenibacillus macerans TaxID=44252 RepID=A0A6N8ESL6_PAEMA|nr:AraC family transcriptional regulator [Paenibacillus macerans]MUG23286.1 helix-turn-helix domain-containing protein [Paenibacillus macerans]UMV45980.1 AraC family transcriptional regulator [Paenibacillus macerans]
MHENPSFVIIVYVIKGEGRHDLGYMNVPITPGELYIVPLTETKLTNAMDTSPSILGLELKQYVYCTESLGMAAPFLPLKWRVLPKHQEELLQLLEIMSPYQGKSPDVSEGGLIPLWTRFMEFFLSHPVKAKLQSFEDDGCPIHQALYHIGNRFMNPISVGEISRRTAMSTRHFQRKFKSLTGRSYKQLLQEIRIRHSCGLLKFTRLSVQTVAEYVGIYDMYHFYRLFRDYCGMTPGAFRRYCQRGNAI